MDALLGILKAGITLAVIMAVIAAVAALFMIFFNLATGIDEQITD